MSNLAPPSSDKVDFLRKIARDLEEEAVCLMWTPVEGYTLRGSLPPESGLEALALVACCARLEDPEFRFDMVAWYLKNQN